MQTAERPQRKAASRKKVERPEMAEMPAPVWESALRPLKGRPNLSFLHVGAGDGRLTGWFLNNVLTDATSRMICIDTWEGDLEQQVGGADMEAIRAEFVRQMEPHGDRVEILLARSQEVLRDLSHDSYEAFDLAYVGGSQIASDVLEDAVLAFRLVRKYGIIVFDGVEQHPFGGNPLLEPKLGVTAFRAAFAGQYEPLYEGEQLVLRKLRSGIDAM